MPSCAKIRESTSNWIHCMDPQSKLDRLDWKLQNWLQSRSGNGWLKKIIHFSKCSIYFFYLFGSQCLSCTTLQSLCFFMAFLYVYIYILPILTFLLDEWSIVVEKNMWQYLLKCVCVGFQSSRSLWMGCIGSISWHQDIRDQIGFDHFRLRCECSLKRRDLHIT